MAKAGNALEPEDVVVITLAAIEEETFLLLPHPRLARRMRRLQREAARATSAALVGPDAEPASGVTRVISIPVSGGFDLRDGRRIFVRWM